MAATKVKSLLKSFKPLEAGAELGKTVSETVAKEVGIKGWEDTWAQIYGSLGQEHHGNGKTGAHAEAAHSEESHDIPTSGDLAPGEVLNLSKMKERPDVKARAESQKKKNVAPGIDYHREIATVSESSNRRQLTEMERKFAQIKDELNRMVES